MLDFDFAWQCQTNHNVLHDSLSEGDAQQKLYQVHEAVDADPDANRLGGADRRLQTAIRIGALQAIGG